jgi:hypothetical protein
MRGSCANPRDAKSQAVFVVVKECQPQRRAEVLLTPIHVGSHWRPVVDGFTEQIQPFLQAVVIQQPGLAVEQVFELLPQTDTLHGY